MDVFNLINVPPSSHPTPHASSGHRGPHTRPAGQEATRAQRAADQRQDVEAAGHAGGGRPGSWAGHWAGKCLDWGLVGPHLVLLPAGTIWPSGQAFTSPCPFLRAMQGCYQLFWLFLIFYGGPQASILRKWPAA